jgi:hypothetical protein
MMKHEIWSRGRALARTTVLALLVSSSLLLPLRAAAALGGAMASVEADQQQMKAVKRTVQSGVNYTVHEITDAHGMVVREYVSPQGTVFGVAWRGPFLPDFPQIFGSYYQQFTQAAAAARGVQPRRSRNAPLAIEQSGLVVHSGGHMRAYSGQAYVPDLLPQGVSPSEIR